MIFSYNWLEKFYRYWSDDDLQNRLRECGSKIEARMIRMELARRAKEVKRA
jgi:hypothetical protein